MKTMITIGLLLVSHLVFQQKNNRSPFLQELNKLLTVKHDYEKFKALAKDALERHVRLRDSSYRVYVAQVEKIKNRSSEYIKHIDRELQNPELDKKSLFFYSYPNSLTSSFDPNKYKISRRDFYRVVKHTLLERDAKLLPETLDDIPIPVRRDYYRHFKLQTEKDFSTEESEKSK